MTEFTEDNQLTEDQEESTEFDVVVPKEEMTFMDEQPDGTFDAHTLSFMSFYIKQFKTDNLEVMNDFDINGVMMELNKFILNNVNYARKALALRTLNIHSAIVESLMQNIEAKSDVEVKDFTSYDQWENWYRKVRAEGKTAMS